MYVDNQPSWPYKIVANYKQKQELKLKSYGKRINDHLGLCSSKKLLTCRYYISIFLHCSNFSPKISNHSEKVYLAHVYMKSMFKNILNLASVTLWVKFHYFDISIKKA